MDTIAAIDGNELLVTVVLILLAIALLIFIMGGARPWRR